MTTYISNAVLITTADNTLRLQLRVQLAVGWREAGGGLGGAGES